MENLGLQRPPEAAFRNTRIFAIPAAMSKKVWSYCLRVERPDHASSRCGVLPLCETMKVEMVSPPTLQPGRSHHPHSILPLFILDRQHSQDCLNTENDKGQAAYNWETWRFLLGWREEPKYLLAAIPVSSRRWEEEGPRQQVSVMVTEPKPPQTK